MAFSAGIIQINIDSYGLIPIPRVGRIERDSTGKNNVDRGLAMRERNNWTIATNAIKAGKVSIQGDNGE